MATGARHFLFDSFNILHLQDHLELHQHIASELSFLIIFWTAFGISGMVVQYKKEGEVQPKGGTGAVVEKT